MMLAAATPGPWEVDRASVTRDGLWDVGHRGDDGYDHVAGECYESDAALIAALRNAAPALIAELRQARKMREGG